MDGSLCGIRRPGGEAAAVEGNLNFNCRLLFVPDRIVDYVVIHELAHRRFMNHSKAFWKEVEKYMPDYKERKKLLSKICYKALIFIEIHGFCRFSILSSISCWIFQSVDCIIVPMVIYGLLITLINLILGGNENESEFKTKRGVPVRRSIIR